MANFAKPSAPRFSVEVYQNEFLPQGGRDVHAIVTVTATGGGTVGSAVAAPHLYAPGQGPAAGVAIMVDCSGSMDYPPTKMRNARDATAAARGVGTDWEVKEVTGIASALLGTADIVADPAGLAADFTQMMETAMGTEVADVALRLWTPVGTTVKFVKQVAPTVEELTGRRTEAGPRAGDYPTGSWGDESRDYHVCVEVPAANIGQEMLAARVSLVVPQPGEGAVQNLGSPGLVKAVWTDDMAASTSINPQVAHYTGQAELAQVIQQGLDLRKAGDFDGATAKLGRAVQLASVSGNADTAKLLAKVVDVVDATTGTVRLKAKVADADEMTLETRSTKTVRVKK